MIGFRRFGSININTHPNGRAGMTKYQMNQRQVRDSSLERHGDSSTSSQDGNQAQIDDGTSSLRRKSQSRLEEKGVHVAGHSFQGTFNVDINYVSNPKSGVQNQNTISYTADNLDSNDNDSKVQSLHHISPRISPHGHGSNRYAPQTSSKSYHVNNQVQTRHITTNMPV